MVFDIMMEWVLVVFNKGIDLGFDGGEELIMIKGDLVCFKELISNLFDNVICYMLDNGKVIVIVVCDLMLMFFISDDGLVILVEECE